MKAEHRFVCGAMLLGATAALSFAACATGTELPETTPGPTTTAGSGGGGTGSGIPFGTIGGPCIDQEDCTEGTCTTVGKDKICTHACPPACPAGTYCAIIEGDPICVPDFDQQCLPCTGSVNCKSPSD